MKKIIKSDKFTYSWILICNTAFSWTAQLKNESLKTVVICSVVFLSALLFALVMNQKPKLNEPARKGKELKRHKPAKKKRLLATATISDKKKSRVVLGLNS
jgi:hypothetical protein